MFDAPPIDRKPKPNGRLKQLNKATRRSAPKRSEFIDHCIRMEQIRR